MEALVTTMELIEKRLADTPWMVMVLCVLAPKH
jgi:hypothetical protein